ncbi:MAG: hypothetical protein HYZ14_17195 [Bacteroidetes bacterium]|nr:hypothetical protein [Bacteroidota bacterium]
MNLVTRLLIVFLSFLPLIGFNQEEGDCNTYFTDGTFTYFDDGEVQGEITIKNDIWKEKFSDKKVTIVSKCEWVSDCTFKLTIIKTKGKTKLHVGQSIIILVYKVEGSKAYYNYKGGDDSVKRYYLKLE